MNVLVIGGAGYIGSHCVRQLIQAGHKPIVLDNLVYGHTGALLKEVKFYKGNLEDKKTVGEILDAEKIDLVMHFAAFINVGESVQNPLKYYRNYGGAQRQEVRVLVDVRDVRHSRKTAACRGYAAAPD